MPSAMTEQAAARKLSILMEIHKALSRSMDLKDSLHAVLLILRESYRIKAGSIFIIDEEGSLRLAAFSGSEKRKPFLTHINPVFTAIAETAKPIIVPQVSRDPAFTATPIPSRGEDSFIGVPVVLDYRTLGVLNVLFAYHPQRHFESALKFLQLTASALLQPVRVHRIIADERKRLQDENVFLKKKLEEEYGFHNIIGNSHQMRDVYEQISRVAETDTTVLLRGESGTGKELMAEALHYNSTRKDKPFIRMNCAAVPETLIESEFFGHEKGAFTGAVGQKKGRFETADSGTVFLDEIGDLAPSTQVKLLRLLQQREFQRVGGNETIHVDIRIIAATHADLEDLISRRLFREDLYYRLNVFTIFIPPLRERKTDILLLADHFMIKYGRRHRKPVRRISTPAIDMLMRYHWPGNVRELENCIEHAVLLCEDVIHSHHLPPTLQTAESSNTVPRLSLSKAVEMYEKEMIQDALKTTRGNRAQAARLLDTTERIIGYKISKY
ncbi:MAG TPA: AAA family ATPase, partial [bacterium]|nr:AAA family ATPase [bacterium]